jgi:hypothetical protein
VRSWSCGISRWTSSSRCSCVSRCTVLQARIDHACLITY